MTAVFYEGEDVTVTADAIRGKSGTYELNSVTSVESGFRVGWLIASAAGVVLCFALGLALPKGSAGNWVFYLAMILCGGLVITNLRYRPVFVRTATGLALLTTLQSSGARERIAAAFLAAKKTT